MVTSVITLPLLVRYRFKYCRWTTYLKWHESKWIFQNWTNRRLAPVRFATVNRAAWSWIVTSNEPSLREYDSGLRISGIREHFCRAFWIRIPFCRIWCFSCNGGLPLWPARFSSRFFAVKIFLTEASKESVSRAVRASLQHLQVKTIDLLLVSVPSNAFGDLEETWRTLEDLVKSGSAESIGVSDFNFTELEKLFKEANVSDVFLICIFRFKWASTSKKLTTQFAVYLSTWKKLHTAFDLC